jgi:phosphate:Na+ symporter
VGAIFTALIQSSSAATGVVITMVGAGVLPLDLALFIILGANIGTCVTALLASVGANANSKRVALIHFTFNTIGTAVFTAIIWIFKDPAVNLLVSMFPGDDPMSLQMRVSLFHVVFNVTTTLLLLPFVKKLVKYSCLIIKDKKTEEEKMSFRYVDERLLSTPHVALIQVKKEIEYMFDLVEENTTLALVSVNSGSAEYDDTIRSNEKIINFTNNSLTKFLIELSTTNMDQTHERVIGSYFHVLNDLERIGDHAKNFCEIAEEMEQKGIKLSDHALNELRSMREKVLDMFNISKNAFEKLNKKGLKELSKIESQVDDLKRDLTASHFARLAEGVCNVDVSPYYSSIVLGLERIADHLVNVGYSIVNPTGSQKQL